MRKLKLSSLKGLDKFQAALMNDGLPAMVEWLKSKKKADLLMTEVHKHIFELGPPTPPEKRTGRSNYYQLLTYHLAEIQTTLDTMRDIEFYMGRFPYSEEKVAKHRHLIFHVQAFLNELYILQQRLLGFLKFIERQHRKDTRLDNIKVVCEALRGFVTESMKKGVAIRGSHVHEWRLSDNDTTGSSVSVSTRRCRTRRYRRRSPRTTTRSTRRFEDGGASGSPAGLACRASWWTPFSTSCSSSCSTTRARWCIRAD